MKTGKSERVQARIHTHTHTRGQAGRLKRGRMETPKQGEKHAFSHNQKKGGVTDERTGKREGETPTHAPTDARTHNQHRETLTSIVAYIYIDRYIHGIGAGGEVRKSVSARVLRTCGQAEGGEVAYERSSTIRAGSSIRFFTFTRKVTASLPSIRRWS